MFVSLANTRARTHKRTRSLRTGRMWMSLLFFSFLFFFFVCVFCVTYPPPFWFALSCLVFALCPSVFPYFSSIPLSVAFPLRPDPPRLLPLLWLLRLLLPLFPLIRCGSCNTTAFFSCLVHLFFPFVRHRRFVFFYDWATGSPVIARAKGLKKTKTKWKEKSLVPALSTITQSHRRFHQLEMANPRKRYRFPSRISGDQQITQKKGSDKCSPLSMMVKRARGLFPK